MRLEHTGRPLRERGCVYCSERPALPGVVHTGCGGGSFHIISGSRIFPAIEGNHRPPQLDVHISTTFPSSCMDLPQEAAHHVWMSPCLILPGGHSGAQGCRGAVCAPVWGMSDSPSGLCCWRCVNCPCAHSPCISTRRACGPQWERLPASHTPASRAFWGGRDSARSLHPSVSGSRNWLVRLG